jgi:hypothetical protein
MSHDWGAKVPDDLPLEHIVEIRDGLRSGEIKIVVEDDVKRTPEVEAWLAECTQQLIVAYDNEIRKRTS